MSKLSYAMLISVLCCVLPVSFIGALGTMVSKKFEVDLAYSFSFGSDKLSAGEIAQNKIIEVHESALNLQLIGYLQLGLFALFGILLLMVKRKSWISNE